MLIFCCGMNRGGSTLQYQIVAEIIESHNLGVALGWIDVPDHKTLKTLDNIACRRDKFAVVKCHEYTFEAAEYIQAGKAKGIYIYRDIRDVVVSLGYKFFDSTDAVISSKCFNSLLYSYYGWSSLENVYTSQYEQVIEDMRQEISNIASFLGIVLVKSQVVQLAQKFSLEKQKEKIDSFDYQQDGIKNITDENIEKDFYDPVSQLHNDHIRSGKHGQWKTELSSQQISQIENAAYSWLVSLSYDLATVDLNSTKTAEEYYDIAREQTKTGNYLLAVDNFHQTIRLFPNKPLYHYQLGEALFKSENYQAAANAYRHAIYLNPKSASYHHRLGETLTKLEQFDQAVNAHRFSIKLKPYTAKFYSSIAETFLLMDRPQKAIPNLKKVISLNKN